MSDEEMSDEEISYEEMLNDEMLDKEFYESLGIPSKRRDGATYDIYFESLKIQLEDLLLATNNLADENIVKENMTCYVYKGQLLQSGDLINILVYNAIPNRLREKRLIHSYMLMHKNIVSIFKIFKLDEDILIIYKQEANGSLKKHLSGPSQVTWIQRLHICVRVADALKYIHYDALDHYHVIHGSIRSSKILLDHNWEPMIHGFESALIAEKHRLHLTREYNGKLPYSDPEYENNGGLTCKSDVFSFGVLLFEVLFGREASIQENDNWYFARLARSHYEDDKLDDLIDPDLRKQMNLQSLEIFAETAYFCIKEQWLQRQDMNQVLSKLEKALELQHKFIDINMALTSKQREFMSNEEFYESLGIPSKRRDGATYDIYFESLKIQFEDLKLATNNFADENLVKQSSSCKVYKGQLLQSGDLINILVYSALPTRLRKKEVIHSYMLMHKNIVSVFKIFKDEVDDDDEKWEDDEDIIIIYKHEANGSLKKHLSGPTPVTWIRRLHICVGVADALKYIHYDALDHHHVIHGNIKSSKILLDHNWKPRIYGFESALIAEKHRLHRTREYNGKLPYSDPDYENSGGVTYKSDVFSFGVLLFEVLFGREASIQANDNWYFARMARSHYEERKLDDLIDPDLRKQMNLQSLEIFAQTAYNCLKEQWLQRPDMNQVLSKLEKALELQHKFENPEATSAPNPLKGKSFDHLRFRLHDIELATNNFSKTYRIGSGGFGEVYKAELKHRDEINSLAIEEKVQTKISNKVSTMAIKRIFSRNDEQGEQGFISEIEMLSKCKHPNIVSLQGFCDEGKEMILVYEYVSNGSLADYLENIDSMTSLTWAQRVQICLDIAHGLKYLHTGIEDKQSIIHRDIKSANILLDHEWVAKLADFGLSKLHAPSQQRSTVVTKSIAGTEVYLDPEYMSTGKLKAKSDVYSFGVVLFEIMCGKLAYDKAYGQKGLPTIARQGFKTRTLNNLVDPKIIEADEIISMLTGGVDQDSLDTFTNVAYKCLAETQVKRPTMEVVIKELQKALNFQVKNKERLRISLKAIKLGTQNFNDSNRIGEERVWKLYEGEVIDVNGGTAIIAKRWNRKFGQGHNQLLREFDILSRYKHKNIIGLVGYCKEMDENIIVYENAYNGTLDKHLGDPSLTWIKRLKICIDVASGLEFLHDRGVDKSDCIIHRDIKSTNVLLDGDWNAKIANFELSCNERVSESAKHVDDNASDSLGYIDPKYQVDNSSTRFSDIYSLGVILIEMLYGRSAWAKSYEDHSQSLDHLAIRDYNEKKSLDEMIFEGIKGQFMIQSMTEFVDIAIQCLKRPQQTSAYEVIKHVKKALALQKSVDDNNLHISLEAIKLGTQNFSDRNCIGDGRFWKLYEGEIVDTKGCTSIIAKRWDSKSPQRHIQHLQTELHILLHYKHKYIIDLVGYCTEMDENIIVYKHAYNGRLDKKLCDPSLTWMKRLKICLHVAKGLQFLHEEDSDNKDSMKHRDIKSGGILLDGDWNAKIYNFEVSCRAGVNDRVEHLDDNCCHSKGYVDPEYETYGFLTQFSDIYSFGVILIEMLCGRLAWGEECEDQSQSLGPLAFRHYNEKRSLDEMIFDGIKQQISTLSLTTFLKIAIGCLHDDRRNNPIYARDLVMRLEEALEFQEDHETWGPRLPMDYKEIIQASRNPIIIDLHMKKDIYTMLSEGVLLQGGKTLFSIGSNGERNELISARMFSYKHRSSHKWRSVERSRFEKAAEMLHISKLKIKIKITTRLLSSGVNYGAYLIFKFSDSKKFSSKPMYVNLKYKMGGENLNAYFATWKDNKWMAIELCRFFSHKKDTDFEVLLESFSRYHCGNGSIYVEGIEFRAIENVQNKHIEQFQQLLKADSNIKFKHFLMQREVNTDEHLMRSATDVLYDSSNVKLFHLHPSTESRFQEVIELLPQHVFRIKCKIEYKMLSLETNYMCYLVFKLSEKCVGLHCPVIVRDLHKSNRYNKKAEIVYFRSPNPWNLHENYSVPRQREDGWMEVKVSKFKTSEFGKFGDGCFPLNLKLITYEGTMSGLIVCGMEFRPYRMLRGQCIESTFYEANVKSVVH